MSVSVVLENAPPNNIFTPSDEVTGVVTIDISGRESTHYGIFLHLTQTTSSSWSRIERKTVTSSSSSSASSSSASSSASRAVTKTRKKVPHRVNYSGSSTKQTTIQLEAPGVLQPGRHVFPFRFQLGEETGTASSSSTSHSHSGRNFGSLLFPPSSGPVTLPSSSTFASSLRAIESHVGHESPPRGGLNYGLVAEVKRAFLKSNPTSSPTRIILAARPTEAEMGPVWGQESKTFLMGSGELGMQATLPRRVAVPSEILAPHVVVSNGSSKTVHAVKVQLVQLASFSASSPRSRDRQEAVVVAEASYPGVMAQHGTLDSVLSLSLPAGLPPSTSSRIFSLGYEVRIRCTVSLGFDLVVALPISIYHAAVFYSTPTPLIVEPLVNEGDKSARRVRHLLAPLAPSHVLLDPPGCLELFHAQPRERTVYYSSYQMYWIDVANEPRHPDQPPFTPMEESKAGRIATASSSAQPAAAGSSSAPPGVPSVTIRVSGVGRSALIVRYMKDNQPGQHFFSSYHGSATDLGGCQYELVLSPGTVESGLGGRWYIGVFGNQLIPPKSTFSIVATFENGAQSQAEYDAYLAILASQRGGDGGVGSSGAGDAPTVDPGYAPPMYADIFSESLDPPPLPDSYATSWEPSAPPADHPPPQTGPDGRPLPSAPPPDAAPPAYTE